MNVLRTPPEVIREPETTGNPPETGKIDLNAFSITGLKGILRGEGLSSKGKVKADYVQRLQKYAVEKGDENYAFIAEKYLHLMKRTPPGVNNIDNDSEIDSEGDSHVVATSSSVNIDLRVGKIESDVSYLGKMMEKVVNMMTDLKTCQVTQNPPPQVSKIGTDVPPHQVNTAKTVQGQTEPSSDQQVKRDVIIVENTQEEKLRSGENSGKNDQSDRELCETRLHSSKSAASDLGVRHTDNRSDIAKNGDQGNSNKGVSCVGTGNRSVTNRDTADALDRTSQQFALVMEMIQQVMQRQDEDKAETMQIDKINCK